MVNGDYDSCLENIKGEDKQKLEQVKLFEILTSISWDYITNYNPKNLNSICELARKKYIKEVDFSIESEESEIFEVINRFYRIVTDNKVRNQIIEYGMNKKDFIQLYIEDVLADYNKREYDKSRMNTKGHIMCEGKAKKIKYVYKYGKKRTFYDKNEKAVSITPIGTLFFKAWNGLNDTIERYCIEIDEGDGSYIRTEVYSNILLGDLEDIPKYRQAVINELLSKKNIELSNSSGYVGEIIKTKNIPGELRVAECPNEQYYCCNTEYALYFDRELLSVVYEFENENKDNEKKFIKPGTFTNVQDVVIIEENSETNDIDNENLDIEYER